MKKYLFIVEGVLSFCAFIAAIFQDFEYAILFITFAIYARLQRKDGLDE